MHELSVFIDESGIQDGLSEFYVVTLVLHEQNANLEPQIEQYRQSLQTRQLPLIPFHANPLKRANKQYENLAPEVRKQLFSSFMVFAKRLPVAYKTFAYKSSDFHDAAHLQAFLRRDLVDFLSANLSYFQGFDQVKVYYDNGQGAVQAATHGAFDLCLATQSLVYRQPVYADFSLMQAADFFCEIELAALKYEAGTHTSTDVKFYGQAPTFKRNFLKGVRRKLFKPAK